MSIKGVKPGDKVYLVLMEYNEQGEMTEYFDEELTIKEVGSRECTVEEYSSRFWYPGGGMIGDGWRQFLSLEKPAQEIKR